MSFNWLFRSEIVILFNWNRRDNTNLDTKFESKFEYDQKFIEFDQKWLKTTGFLIDFNIFYWIQPFSIEFDHFWLNNWHNFQSFNQKRSKKDWKLSTLIKIRSKLYQNCDPQYNLIVEIQIGPKSTIKFGRLGVRIVDDLILEA